MFKGRELYKDNLRDQEWLGEVMDVRDPLKRGRVRIKVYGKYDDIPEEDYDKLPWALPGNIVGSGSGWHKTSPREDEREYVGGGDNFSMPKVGQIVTVKFNSGNAYEPTYYVQEHISENVISRYNSNPEEDDRNDDEFWKYYENSHYIIYDTDLFHQNDWVKLYYNQKEGMIMEVNRARLNITSHGSLYFENNYGIENPKELDYEYFQKEDETLIDETESDWHLIDRSKQEHKLQPTSDRKYINRFELDSLGNFVMDLKAVHTTSPIFQKFKDDIDHINGDLDGFKRTLTMRNGEPTRSGIMNFNVDNFVELNIGYNKDRDKDSPELKTPKNDKLKRVDTDLPDENEIDTDDSGKVDDFKGRKEDSKDGSYFQLNVANYIKMDNRGHTLWRTAGGSKPEFDGDSNFLIEYHEDSLNKKFADIELTKDKIRIGKFKANTPKCNITVEDKMITLGYQGDADSATEPLVLGVQNKLALEDLYDLINELATNTGITFAAQAAAFAFLLPTNSPFATFLSSYIPKVVANRVKLPRNTLSKYCSLNKSIKRP